MRALLLFCLLITLLSCSPALRQTELVNNSPLLSQYRFSDEPIDSLVVADVLPELEAAFGNQKTCAPKYRDKFLAALSFYPELKDVEIRVFSKQIKTSMAVRPHRFHLARQNRSYTIYVDDISEDKPVDFRKASYSAQVGCFAHELAHIMYYQRRSNVTLMRSGVSYVSSQNFRSSFEKIADNITIRHGAGFYIYQFATFVLEKAPISDEYRDFKEENYYDNDEILELHEEYVERLSEK